MSTGALVGKYFVPSGTGMPRCRNDILFTECPKIDRKSVLHLLQYRGIIKQMQYRIAVNFEILST